MAQQAKPNCSGQIEDLRPQLYSCSKGRTKIPCFCSSLFRPSSTAMSFPIQCALGPRVNQPLHQEQHKNHHCDECTKAQPAKRHCPWVEEYGLDGENHVDQGVD